MEQADVMRVILFPEGGKPRLVDLKPDDLESAQALVEGDLEMVRLKRGLALFCNENGIHLEMEPNRMIPPALCGWFDPWRSTIRGPFYISTQDESDLTDEEIRDVLHAFGETLEVSDKVEQSGAA